MRPIVTCLSLSITALVINPALSADLPFATQFLGPSPYLAFDHPDAGLAVSPFRDITFEYFYLEDFEDGSLNTPGVSLRETGTTNIATEFTDSVDGDDGVIDGFATGNTKSFHSNFATSSFTFDFSASDLGGMLPTHAGVVWTDVRFAFLNNTVFEAFGPQGDSLGVVGPVSLGDSSISRTTDEDRFFGAINPGGISAIRISMPASPTSPEQVNWEIDHLQYGSVIVPEPGGLLLAALAGLSTIPMFRRSRPRTV